MKRSVALVALALWALVGSAHAQEPVPFDYRCDAAAAATTPAALPADGWQRAEDGELPRAAGSPCWLRIDVARFAPRILSAGQRPAGHGSRRVLARRSPARRGGATPARASRSSSAMSSAATERMLFPTLRAEDGPVLMRVQRSRDVTLAAVDLARAVQAERNSGFVHLGVGLFYAIVALVAVALGVLGRDRGQFVFAALFAWLAIGEWENISPSLPAGLASGVWPPGALGLSSGTYSCSWPRRSCCELRERAPRWHRWMIVTARAVPAGHPAVRRSTPRATVRPVRLPAGLVLFSVVGLAASWRVWRLGHRVGAVGGVLFALDAAVYQPYLLAEPRRLLRADRHSARSRWSDGRAF